MLRPDYGRAVVIRPLPRFFAHGAANGQPECARLPEFEPGVWHEYHMGRQGVLERLSMQFAKNLYIRVDWRGGLRLLAESTK
jgi:hypothetical protein